MKDIKVFKILWKYLKKEKGMLFLYIFLVALSYMPIFLTSLCWGRAITFLTMNNFNMFSFYIFLYTGVYLLFYGLLYIPEDYAYKYLQITFVKEATKDLYDKMLDLPVIAYEEKGVGELINRLCNDPDVIMDLLTDLINLMCRSLTVVAIIVIAFNTSYILVFELIMLAIVMGFITSYFQPKIRKTQEEIKKESDEYSRLSTENLTGIREIKALGITKRVSQKMHNMMEVMFDKQLKISKYERWYEGFNNLLYFTLQGVIFFTCGKLYIEGVITLTVFMMMQTYIWQIDGVVESLNKYAVKYNKIIVSLKRMDEILSNKLYEDEQFGNVELESVKGNITFNDVYFRYREDEKNTLNGLSLKIEPNKKIAIVGRSGNGKTTIYNVLLRYFPINKGSVLLDDVKIEDLTRKSLRNSISIIRQDPYIFHMSIFDNFRLIKEDVTLKEVREYCKKAYLDDYIMSLPDKYNTMIGEGGVNLSGGQKQRLAIARTLMRDTKIVLFDEATSALDNESQEYIKKTIDDLVKDHTVVIIAHRLSTIIDADEIYVIDKGILVGKGTHKSLLKNNKIYQTLYKNEEKKG